MALYLRVSTGRQAESDQPIPDQGRQLRAYCEGKSWPVAEEFIEPGNTATDDRLLPATRSFASVDWHFTKGDAPLRFTRHVGQTVDQ